jgi:enoyl-CoA hydratase/carnithine racemase
LLISARLVRAAEAERIGLVNRIVAAADLLTEARAYAKQLVDNCSPFSMRSVKQQVFQDLARPFIAGFENSEAMLDAAFLAPDFKEGMVSWQEGRSPTFPPLPDSLAIIELQA